MSARKARSPHPAKRQVYLVEDHPVTREGFAQLINYQADLEVCGQAGTAAKANTGIDTLKPDIVIVDLSLGDVNGIELIKNVHARYPRLAMLVLSTYDESLYAERALRAGARGYVMKQAPTAEVMAAIRTVLGGELYMSESLRTKLVHKHLGGAPALRKSDTEHLSDRELQVFELIGQGCSTRDIATRLHLSVSTVETHRAHIKEKLGLRDAIALVRRAVEHFSRPRV